MANYFKGTLVASPLVKGSKQNTYGTHQSVLGVGGFMELENIGERNNIPVDSINGIGFDNISSGQRRIGMLVYVHEENIIYQLQIPFITWNTYTNSEKISALLNNDNWIVFLNVSNLNTTERISKTFTQINHGFEVGNVLSYNNLLNQYVLSNTTNISIYEPLGLVTNIVNNNVTLTYSGYISIVGIKDTLGNDLESGNKYYLSLVDGKLINVKPTGIDDYIKPILVTLNTSSGVVLQYNGKFKSEDGVTYDDFITYVNETSILLDETIDGATNIGHFIGLDGIQTLTINAFADNGGNYESLYNNYYRDSGGIIRIGAPFFVQERRGYVKTDKLKSWVWNTHTGGGDRVGWILVDGNIETNIGNLLNSINYTGDVYDETEWIDGGLHNNGGNLTINPHGNINTGQPYVNGGGLFSNKSDKKINLKTILSTNRELLDITEDEAFIYLTPTESSIVVENGLFKDGNKITLGGDIIQPTIFNDNRQIPVGFEYGGSYMLTFKKNSLVDKEYVDSKINTTPVNIVTSSTYNVTDDDYSIGGRSDPDGCMIFLPPQPKVGRTINVFDFNGNAGDVANNNIHINGNSKNILNMNVATINSNYGSITLKYNGYFWSVIAFTTTPTYS